MEEFITVQKYAALHRLSIHTVIKKTMSGELPSFEKEENGKKTIYIRYGGKTDSAVTAEPQASKDDEDCIDYKKEYEELHKEYLLLKTKYEKLLQQLQNV